MPASAPLSIVLDPNGRVHRLNDPARALLSSPDEPLTNLTVQKLLNISADEWTTASASTPVRLPVEPLVQASDGSLRLIDWILTRSENPSDADAPLILFGLDQTERNRQRLAESDARATAILNTIVDGVISVDEQGVIECVNPAACNIFAYSASEMEGQPLTILVAEPHRSMHENCVQRYVRTGEPHLVGSWRELRGRRKDGSEFPLDLAVSEVRTRDRRTFTGIIRDISERRRLESEVLEISSIERRLIGQDLHDGVCQELTAIGMYLELVERDLADLAEQETSAGGRTHAHADLAASISNIHDMVDHVNREARAIARGLSPVNLDANGLSAALDDLARSMSRLGTAQIEFQDDPSLTVENHLVATHLFRIAQEALSNAIHHGRARHIRIALRRGRDGLQLTITDDGIGIDAEAQQQPPETNNGMGLHLMRYRAATIGCRFSVRPGSEGGTVVEVVLPTLDEVTLTSRADGEAAAVEAHAPTEVAGL